jgi:hypothetical protein
LKCGSCKEKNGGLRGVFILENGIKEKWLGGGGWPSRLGVGWMLGNGPMEA